MFTRERNRVLDDRSSIGSGQEYMGEAVSPANWRPADPTQSWTAVVTRNNTVETMYDNPTVGFHRLSRSGQIVNTEMLSVKAATVVDGVSHRKVHVHNYTSGTPPVTTQWGAEVTGAYNLTSMLSYHAQPVPPATGPTLLSLASQANAEARANASKPAVQGLVCLIELKKTITGVSSILKNALKIFKYIGRQRKLYELGVLSYREFREKWMQARYVLRPLYYDIRGTAEGLVSLEADLPAYRPTRTTSRGKATATLSANGQDDSGVFNGYRMAFKTRQRWFVDIDLSVRTGILLQSELRGTVPGAFGLRPRDILPAMWELLPWSFVADWFVDIGARVASLANSYQIYTRGLASWYTVEQTVTTTRELVPSDAPTCTENSGSCQGCQVEYFGKEVSQSTTYWRIPNATAVPDFELMPRLNVNLNVSKILDLIFMLTQLAKGL